MRAQLDFQMRSKFLFEDSHLLNKISALALAGDAVLIRTRLRAKSLLTGNFTGKRAILMARRHDP
jgi:hypothetical protein